MSNKLVKCHDERSGCFAIDKKGYCKCLSDTHFDSGICPFYKTREQVIKEDKYYFGYTKRGC